MVQWRVALWEPSAREPWALSCVGGRGVARMGVKLECLEDGESRGPFVPFFDDCKGGHARVAEVGAPACDSRNPGALLSASKFWNVFVQDDHHENPETQVTILLSSGRTLVLVVVSPGGYPLKTLT